MNMHIETKSAPTDLDAITAAIEAHTNATAATIAKQQEQIGDLKSILFELEQKAAGHPFPYGGINTAPDLAALLVKDPLVTALASKSRRDGGQIMVKTAQLLEQKSTVTGDPATQFNISQPAGIFGGLERRRFLYDVLPRVFVGTGSVATVREVSFVNNAAVVAETAAKPESDLVFELLDLRLPTIAHWIKVSIQALSDVGMLRGLLDSRLRYGLRVKQDAEILSTLTTAGNFTAFTPTSGDTAHDSISRAMALLEAADAMPDLVVLNPSTWRAMQRLRTTDNAYLLATAPMNGIAEREWGVTVLPTNSMPAGQLLVLDTAAFGQYYIREEGTIDVGFSGDDFLRNLSTLRGELRGALQVVRPAAVAYGALTV